MRTKLSKIQAFAPDEFAEALYQEAKVEEAECKRLCPEDKKLLVRSIHATRPERRGRRIWCTIVAGEPGSGAEEYTLIVHEDPEAHHRKGQWKFIETPLNESAPYMSARIGRRIDLNKAL
jgi:hypothetical protein